MKKNTLKVILVSIIASVAFVLLISEPVENGKFFLTLLWTKSLAFALIGIAYLIGRGMELPKWMNEE